VSKRDWSSDVCSSDLDWVKGAGKFVQQAINKVVDTTGFDGSEKWWRTSYAATAGVGLIFLVGLWLKTWADSAHGLLEPGEMGSTLMPWGLVRSEERRVGKGWR